MFGATQLLMMSSIDESQRANLNIIASSIGQLRDVLTSVLDLAKMNNGAMELEQLPFDLPSTLQQVACQFLVARLLACLLRLACLPRLLNSLLACLLRRLVD
jgi:signal transduction histidine kinase